MIRSKMALILKQYYYILNDVLYLTAFMRKILIKILLIYGYGYKIISFFNIFTIFKIFKI
jgi:hypothetical protein